MRNPAPTFSSAYLSAPFGNKASNKALPTLPLHTLGPACHKRHRTKPNFKRTEINFPGEFGRGSGRTVGARKTAQRLEPDGSKVGRHSQAPGTGAGSQKPEASGGYPERGDVWPKKQGESAKKYESQCYTRNPAPPIFLCLPQSPPSVTKPAIGSIPQHSPRKHQVPDTIRSAGPSLFPSALVPPILQCDYPGDS